jgi:hypothetical protein
MCAASVAKSFLLLLQQFLSRMILWSAVEKKVLQ